MSNYESQNISCSNNESEPTSSRVMKKKSQKGKGKTKKSKKGLRSTTKPQRIKKTNQPLVEDLISNNLFSFYGGILS